MFVDTILHTKGSLVHTMPETATLAAAINALNTHNIGALVITDPAGAIVGILSERDIVRRLGQGAASILDLPIADAMTRDVQTCARDTEIGEVMERMTQFRVRHMPITENGRLLGIVSIGDVVKFKIEQAEREAEDLRGYIAGDNARTDRAH
ncbi:hypothetical protein WH87_16470 [Devosia epidermidihirudinis]|uniref:CBS domain-containing protein n=1 Tax=Devosia epidermidihirudinis TaxID=1293439 RepID=A0A0F5Q3Y7_9HYPH|nr:CBS domain-containing protein [Devosia epidermidihirudinis]KKC35633.1 hypothetical protein WH87_16470 [Devosia epidermidihirudinis]